MTRRPYHPLRARLFALAATIFLTLAPSMTRTARAQSLDLDRERGRDMLDALKQDIKKNYYDPTFHGVDLDARFKDASEKIKGAKSVGQIFGIVAQTLLDFDDSHLYFIPPARAATYDYGWRMQMIGDKCFVTAVKPGSDAEGKGLKAGDEIVSVNGFEPTRDNHWKMLYYFYALRPQPGMRVVVAKPGGEPRQLDVMAKVTQGRRVKDLTGDSGTSSYDINELDREAEDAARASRDRYAELGEDLMIWKMNEFAANDAQIDDMMAKARKHKALILDLRGNGGGYETTLLRLLGNLFDHDVTLGDVKRRKETKPIVAKTRGADHVFAGKLVVLVDSQSESAAELFARVVQLEKRGEVVGDRSPGAVMRAKEYEHTLGTDSVSYYGASITDADILMADGGSLEHVGVQPDHVMLPTGADMLAGRDTVLAYAASLAGVKLAPEKAGAMFPIEWKK
jgi:C-terminal processing protease CtpA/Prc